MELLQRIRWDQAYDFLAAGDPPMIFRLLALNTVFIILFVVRRSRGAMPMEQSGMLVTQGLLVAANLLVMFHNDVLRLLDRAI